MEDERYESMRRLGKTEIPEALSELGTKHEYVNEVIQWCESSYVTGNKSQVQAQTKEYIVDALDNITKEVEATSGKLMEFLADQDAAIEDMTTQLAIVKERLSISKELNAHARLAQFRKPLTVEPRKDKVQQLTDDERSEHMPVIVGYEKDFDARFRAFDDVGTCLHS